MLVDPGSINWWAVLTAAIVGHAIAVLWYSPPVLRKPMTLMATRFLLTLVTAAVLALIVVRFGAVNWIEGAVIGLVLSAGLVATSLLSEGIFRDFGMKLFAIQIGRQLIGITAMGAILGAWR